MRPAPSIHLLRPIRGVFNRSQYFRVIVTGVFAVLILTACSKRPPGQSIGSDIEDVFSGKLIETRTSDQEPWREKGLRLAKERQFEQAIEAFMRHIEEDPEESFGFNALAVCYKNRGDHTMAMKNFERALEFAESREDRAKVLANIGNLYFSTNKPQAALGYYKEAATEFEKNPLYFVLIARTFLVLNEPERARKVLDSAEENLRGLEKYQRDDEKGLGYYLMSHCFASLGEEDKVLKYVELAVKANPDKYVLRMAQDSRSPQSLLYTMKDHPDLRRIIDKYAGGLSPGRWLDQD